MTGEHLLHGVRDLADGGLRARRRHRQLEQVGVAGRAVGQLGEARLHVHLVALGPEPLQLLDLRSPHGRIVDFQNVDLGIAFDGIFVDAHDRLLAGIDAGLRPRRRFLDASLWNARLDRLGHAAQGLDFLDVPPCLGREVGREPLDEVGPAPRIDHPAGARLLLQKQLRIARDAG